MTEAFINKIATAVPPHDVHQAFVEFGRSLLQTDARRAALFERMAERAEIEHRYSYLDPDRAHCGSPFSAYDFYKLGQFPGTGARMRLFQSSAPPLAEAAVNALQLGSGRNHITHVLVTCCTGFSAPGLDIEIIDRCDLPSSVERTLIGFMGCYAAINALKLAYHIVRSDAKARVIVLNLELCSLHLQATVDLDEILSFLIFGDGCAAALITAEPDGFALDSFHSVLVPRTRGLITWDIGDFGFNMFLSGQVPGALFDALRSQSDDILKGKPIQAVDLWAVHPGGRSILDAVERGLNLEATALSDSREVLRQVGNVSSASVMFVLERMLRTRASGRHGCAMAFGPGLIAETMLFHTG